MSHTAITSGGNLSCKYLMHVNIPRYRNDLNDFMRVQAYRQMETSVKNILDSAEKMGDVESIVIPALTSAPRKGF